MSQIGSSTSRLTQQSISNNLLSSLRRTSWELDEAQQQIATGKRVNRPADAPSTISLIQALRRQLEARQQYDRNLQHAGAVLNSADQSLADVADILIEAHNIALEQSGVGSDAGTREAMATMLDSQIQALIELANRQVAGIGMFSGALPADGRAFVDFLGGVRYVGGALDLTTDVGLSEGLSMNRNGSDAFNLDSGVVFGRADLDPTATATVQLDDVAGATNQGVRRGSVLVTVNGTSLAVDLADARTLGDVETRINNTIAAIDPAAGALALSGAGFELTANAGHTIGLGESGQGKTASDLGIELLRLRDGRRRRRESEVDGVDAADGVGCVSRLGRRHANHSGRRNQDRRLLHGADCARSDQRHRSTRPGPALTSKRRRHGPGCGQRS